MSKSEHTDPFAGTFWESVDRIEQGGQEPSSGAVVQECRRLLDERKFRYCRSLLERYRSVLDEQAISELMRNIADSVQSTTRQDNPVVEMEGVSHPDTLAGIGDTETLHRAIDDAIRGEKPTWRIIDLINAAGTNGESVFGSISDLVLYACGKSAGAKNFRLLEQLVTRYRSHFQNDAAGLAKMKSFLSNGADGGSGETLKALCLKLFPESQQVSRGETVDGVQRAHSNGLRQCLNIETPEGVLEKNIPLCQTKWQELLAWAPEDLSRYQEHRNMMESVYNERGDAQCCLEQIAQCQLNFPWIALRNYVDRIVAVNPHADLSPAFGGESPGALAGEEQEKFAVAWETTIANPNIPHPFLLKVYNSRTRPFDCAANVKTLAEVHLSAGDPLRGELQASVERLLAVAPGHIADVITEPPMPKEIERR